MPRIIIPAIIIIGVVIFQSVFIVQEIIQEILDEYTSGIQITQVKLKKLIHQIK